MHIACETERAQFLLGIADYCAEGRVAGKEAVVHIPDDDAGGSALKDTAEPFLAFAERFLGPLAFGDIYAATVNTKRYGAGGPSRKCMRPAQVIQRTSPPGRTNRNS